MFSSVKQAVISQASFEAVLCWSYQRRLSTSDSTQDPDQLSGVPHPPSPVYWHWFLDYRTSGSLLLLLDLVTPSCLRRSIWRGGPGMPRDGEDTLLPSQWITLAAIGRDITHSNLNAIFINCAVLLTKRLLTKPYRTAKAGHTYMHLLPSQRKNCSHNQSLRSRNWLSATCSLVNCSASFHLH